MRWMLSLALVFLSFSFLANQAHAIIFLPALVLIPIAKIVAVLIGGFSLPAFGVGALSSKLFKKSLKKVLFTITLLLLLFGGVVVLLLKFFSPDRPLF